MKKSSPAPKTTLLRPDDLLLLDFDFINLNLEWGDSYGSRLVPVPGKQSYIIVNFPPQNIAEEAIFEESNLRGIVTNYKPSYALPDPDVSSAVENISLPLGSRLSGQSRLVFEVPESIKEIPYTIQGLLDWSKFTQSVAPTALPEGEKGDRPPIQDPRSIYPPATFLELPYRLFLSPNRTAGWAHQTDLDKVTHDGRTELWHTRLGILKQKGAEQEVQEGTGDVTLRAIWSPDYNPDNHKTSDPPAFNAPNHPFRMSLNAFDRHQIVRLSSDYHIKSETQPVEYYNPQPIAVNKLMLSSLGAWMNTSGVWNDPKEPIYTALRIKEGLIVSEWRHVASQGRDQYARIVYQGCLFPFGNKASLIKITERKIADVGGHPLAYLSQRMFIVVRQPEVSYSDEVFDYEDPTHGRDNPFRKSIKITTLVTPDIVDPTTTAIPNTGAFWIKVMVNSQPTPFMFHIIVKDEEGKDSEFDAALIFIPIDQCSSWDTVNLIRDPYKNSADRVCNLHGQKVAFAKRNELKEGDTTLITEELYFDVKRGVQSCPLSYLPILDVEKAASVRIPAVEQLLGTNEAINIKQADKYLHNDKAEPLGNINNRAGIFVEVTGHSPLSVPPDKAGGLAAPNMDLTAISQDLGPVAGELEDLAAGNFAPNNFFKVDAKLLGEISLQKIIPQFTLSASPDDSELEQFRGRFPKITSRQEQDSIISTLDWSSKVKKYPYSAPFFLPNEAATRLDIHSTIEKKLSQNGSNTPEPTYLISGKLNDFAINFVDIIEVNFKLLSFRAKTGEKMDASAEIEKVNFLGPLSFVSTLADYLPSSSNPGFVDPPSVDVSTDGVTVGYTLGLPPIAVGVFSLQNVGLSAGLSLPFVDKPSSLSFAFSERHNPFLLTVSLFAGGGFFSIALGPGNIQMIEASLEFGGNISIDLGVASGGVYVMAGIYFKYDNTDSSKKIDVTGYFRCGGALEILGIISVSVEFYLGLSYGTDSHGAENKIWGQATLTVTVEVLFFSKSVHLTVEKTFAGAGNDPTFGDLVSTYDDWKEYALAYA